MTTTLWRCDLITVTMRDALIFAAVVAPIVLGLIIRDIWRDVHELRSDDTP